MNKLKMTAAALVLGAGMAGAQAAGPLTVRGFYGVYKLTGCYSTKDGVRCDFTYEPSEDTTTTFSVNNFGYVNAAGETRADSKVSLKGAPWTDQSPSLKVYKGIPVKVSYLFDAPANTKSLRILLYQGNRVADNVPVGGSSASTPTPMPVTAPANSGAYNAVLTNCKPGGNGALICTATLTPKR